MTIVFSRFETDKWHRESGAESLLRGSDAPPRPPVRFEAGRRVTICKGTIGA